MKNAAPTKNKSRASEHKSPSKNNILGVVALADGKRIADVFFDADEFSTWAKAKRAFSVTVFPGFKLPSPPRGTTLAGCVFSPSAIELLGGLDLLTETDTGPQRVFEDLPHFCVGLGSGYLLTDRGVDLFARYSKL